MKIYLAGNSGDCDWKGVIVGIDHTQYELEMYNEDIPILGRHTASFIDWQVCDKIGQLLPDMLANGLDLIKKADMVFAYMHDYHDLSVQYELHYAHSLKKIIYVCFNGARVYKGFLTSLFWTYTKMLRGDMIHSDIVINNPHPLLEGEPEGITNPYEALQYFLKRDDYLTRKDNRIVMSYEYRDHLIVIWRMYSSFTAVIYDLRYPVKIIKGESGLHRWRYIVAYRTQRVIDRWLMGGRCMVRKWNRGHTWIGDH